MTTHALTAFSLALLLCGNILANDNPYEARIKADPPWCIRVKI